MLYSCCAGGRKPPGGKGSGLRTGGAIALASVRLNSAGDYWMVYHTPLPHFALMLSHQQSGQAACERLQNVEKRISTKTRNLLGDKVNEAMTEVKMSEMRKRCELDNQKKMSKRSELDNQKEHGQSHCVGGQAGGSHR